jgi:hypothetical protein
VKNVFANNFWKFTRRALAAALLTLVGLQSTASSAVFNLGPDHASGSHWGNIGSGIGTGPGQLDLRFDVNDAIDTFEATLDTDSSTAQSNAWTFHFGSITLNEPIGLMEADGLGVTAYVDFELPPDVGDVAGPATIAVQGGLDWLWILPYPDFTDKLVISFQPVEVAFGNGGLFSLSLSGGVLSDDNTPNTLDIYASITLLSESQSGPVVNVPPVSSIPEPATIGIWGIGALCMTALRRRRRK